MNGVQAVIAETVLEVAIVANLIFLYDDSDR